MPLPDDATYTVTGRGAGRCVIISAPGHPDAVLIEPALLEAIENIQANEKTYATRAAYQRHLHLYTRALDVLRRAEFRAFNKEAPDEA